MWTSAFDRFAPPICGFDASKFVCGFSFCAQLFLPFDWRALSPFGLNRSRKRFVVTSSLSFHQMERTSIVSCTRLWFLCPLNHHNLAFVSRLFMAAGRLLTSPPAHTWFHFCRLLVRFLSKLLYIVRFRRLARVWPDLKMEDRHWPMKVKAFACARTEMGGTHTHTHTCPEERKFKTKPWKTFEDKRGEDHKDGGVNGGGNRVDSRKKKPTVHTPILFVGQWFCMGRRDRVLPNSQSGK